MFLNENFLLKPTLWQYLQYSYRWWTVVRTSEVFQGFVGVFMGCSLSGICGGRSLCWSNDSVAWFCIVSNSVPSFLCCLCSMSIKILNGYYKISLILLGVLHGGGLGVLGWVGVMSAGPSAGGESWGGSSQGSGELCPWVFYWSMVALLKTHLNWVFMRHG